MWVKWNFNQKIFITQSNLIKKQFISKRKGKLMNLA